MSLRDEMIEAGARALQRIPAPGPIEYNRARIALDAFLDTLSVRADEWVQSSLVSDEAVGDWVNSRSVEIVGRLVAVLREDTR